MKRKLIIWIFLLAASMLISGPASPVHSAPPPLPAKGPASAGLLQPIYGWVVCGDLGIGIVPARGFTAQRVLICNGDAWQVRTFCLEPFQPVPPIGTHCDRVDATTFWCGEENQLLRAFEWIQIEVGPTNTPRPAPSATPIPSPTRTPTRRATAVAAEIVTVVPTFITPQATGERQRPGGSGNAAAFIISTFLSAGLLGFSAFGLRKAWKMAKTI